MKFEVGDIIEEYTTNNIWIITRIIDESDISEYNTICVIKTNLPTFDNKQSNSYYVCDLDKYFKKVYFE